MRHLPVAAVLDDFAPSLSLVLVVAKLNCLVAGCCYGRPTSLPLYVLYGPNSAAGRQWPLTPLFPTQLLESALAAGVMLVTLYMERRQPEGLVFATWLMGFGATRALAGFLRSYEAADWVRVGGHSLPLFQLMGGLLAGAGLLAILVIRRRAGGGVAYARTTIKSGSLELMDATVPPVRH
jgi:phosphatidylglycerol:prolipoprotein diacylglycerol transferase